MSRLVLVDLDFLEEQVKEIERVRKYHLRKAQYYEIKEELLRKKLKELVRNE